MTATLAIGAALAALGFGAVTFILVTWYRAVATQYAPGLSLRGVPERIRIYQHSKTLSKVDALIEQGNFPVALTELRGALLLAHIKSGPELIDQSVHLNLAVLSRILSLSERAGAHLENLAVVEDLVQSRGQLLTSYFEAQRDRRVFKSRRSSAGKDAPEWAIAEFTRRVDELKDRIDTNSRSLQMQLDELLRDVTKGSQASVTYH